MEKFSIYRLGLIVFLYQEPQLVYYAYLLHLPKCDLPITEGEWGISLEGQPSNFAHIDVFKIHKIFLSHNDDLIWMISTWMDHINIS